MFKAAEVYITRPSSTILKVMQSAAYGFKSSRSLIIFLVSHHLLGLPLPLLGRWIPPLLVILGAGSIPGSLLVILDGLP